jgi:LDH2 family malate/lactate/ureidoglycolate dehydrogenase
MSDPEDYAARVEALVDATRSADRATWADQILVPGELEDRNAELNAQGITLPPTTWASLAKLATETGVDLPHQPPRPKNNRPARRATR